MNYSIPPESRLDPKFTVESYERGHYTDRETATIPFEAADEVFDSEVRRIMAIRTKETEWEPIVVRLLDASNLEIRRTVIT